MRTRRKTGLAVLLATLAIVAPSLFAQDAAPEDPEQELYARLTREERQAVVQATTRAQDEVRVAKAELDIVRAQMNRLLLGADVDMKEVERLLRQGLEWELKVRLAEIAREREIRRILGDRRWAEFVQLRNRLAERARTAIPEATVERIRKLAQDLGDLAPRGQDRPAMVRRLENMLRELVQSAAAD